MLAGYWIEQREREKEISIQSFRKRSRFSHLGDYEVLGPRIKKLDLPSAERMENVKGTGLGVSSGARP